MSKKKQVLYPKLEDAINEIIARYTLLNEYLERKFSEREWLSTKQVAQKYCVSRHTVGRLQRSGQLKPVAKYRTYYFDPEETQEVFKNYWHRN